ncbi:MAG: hypothetical protein L3K03_05060 [Thermoplasmata archaeon]|nr:hypothetical protein [Thermoplasmata archaeon]
MDPLDSFLKAYVAANSGRRLGDIVQAGQREYRVSRRTIARRLSRLVRFGEVTILPNHTYAETEATASATRALVELRWFDAIFVIQPDGGARVFHHEEFRVVSGQLDHVEFNQPRRPQQFIWWFSSAGHASMIPAHRSLSNVMSHHVEFVTPLSARKPTWQRLSVNRSFSAGYRMAHTPRSGRRDPRGWDEAATESESLQVQSQGRRFGQRLTSDAHLRMQVVLPERYPIGPVRCRVRFVTEPGRVDSAEETRLSKLQSDDARQDGLRRFGSTLTLSVPHPLVDRHYQIEWTLPTVAQRNRWLAARRRRRTG